MGMFKAQKEKGMEKVQKVKSFSMEKMMQMSLMLDFSNPLIPKNEQLCELHCRLLNSVDATQWSCLFGLALPMD
jgi:hypothetical protein